LSNRTCRQRKKRDQGEDKSAHGRNNRLRYRGLARKTFSQIPFFGGSSQTCLGPAYPHEVFVDSAYFPHILTNIDLKASRFGSQKREATWPAETFSESRSVLRFEVYRQFLVYRDAKATSLPRGHIRLRQPAELQLGKESHSRGGERCSSGFRSYSSLEKKS
jgi:hypothetical protein